MNNYLYEKSHLQNKYRSKLHYVLTSLIPYSEANIKLTFKPHAFFHDLDKFDAISRDVAKVTYYRAIKQGYIQVDADNTPRITNKGWRKLELYRPTKLRQGACLIVTFDIPEIDRFKRRQLRVILREFKFKQIQLSVWQSEYDSVAYLKQEVKRLKLENQVKVYEAVAIVA